jgi:hypothetical protein
MEIRAIAYATSHHRPSSPSSAAKTCPKILGLTASTAIWCARAASCKACRGSFASFASLTISSPRKRASLQTCTTFRLSRCVDNLVAAIGHVPFMLVGRGNGRLRQELAEEMMGWLSRTYARDHSRKPPCHYAEAFTRATTARTNSPILIQKNSVLTGSPEPFGASSLGHLSRQRVSVLPRFERSCGRVHATRVYVTCSWSRTASEASHYVSVGVIRAI